MDNMIESNERTLVMFDAVCAGLANCLALVHSDIKQMTEHRNELSRLEHQQQVQARLAGSARAAAAIAAGGSLGHEQASPNESGSESNKSASGSCGDGPRPPKNRRKDASDPEKERLANELRLLDKRLADSFSQALNLSGATTTTTNQQQQQSRLSWTLKKHNKPSLFQVLLGKSRHSTNPANNNNSRLADAETKKLDNQTIIDDINRQTRMAMQYSKQLEAHLFKVEDLRSKYEMHLKMGLVVKSVARAYSSPSIQSSVYPAPQQSAANRTTIKEFIENIARIEEEFETYMGSFLVAIEDIQGFARVCQGDVFEISIKYGEVQKLKSRISVLKENRQKCDNRQSVFKARITDVLAIKAYECKGLGKRVLLGHKLCETRDLFTARTQLMTISLNQTGSIKLNLIVTWNPLHMSPSSASSMLDTDIAHVSYPPLSSTLKMSTSNLSVPSIYSATASACNQPETITTINIQSQTGHKLGGVTARQQKQQHLHDPLYQMVDPTYGYYVPPPDYLSNELKYSDP